MCKSNFCVPPEGLDTIFSLWCLYLEVEFQWKWCSYRGETAWCVSYPRRTDINLSKALGCALRLTVAIHEQTVPQCPQTEHTHSSPMYEPAPASWITSDWQMTAESFLLLRSFHTNLSPTQNHKGTSWQVQLTSPCFHQQLCPTSPLQSEWQMTARV